MLLPADFGLESSGLNQLQLYSSAYLSGKKNHSGTNALLVRASHSHPCTEARRAGTAEPLSCAEVKPMIVHFAHYQQNWQLNSDDKVFIASQNTRN